MGKAMERESGRSLNRTRALVMTALMAAMACVATMVIKIPSPNGGYMNLGDTVVLLGAYLLGPVYGALAGGIGSALADLLNGYPVYVPVTLVIKAAMALAAGLLYRASRRLIIVCGILAEAIMVVGYWLFEAALAAGPEQSFAAALAGTAVGIPSNLVQAAFGLVLSTLLAVMLRKSGYVRREFPNL